MRTGVHKILAKSRNLIFVDMPGSGKSTVGVLIAKRLGLGFLDTDLLIQQETGGTVVFLDISLDTMIARIGDSGRWP